MENESVGSKIKLWIHLHKDDLVGFFKIFVPMLLLVFIVRQIPSITRMFILSKLDTEIFGVIDTIEKREGVHESQIGGKVIIMSYKLNYHYLIEEEKINQSEIIDRKSVNLKQKIILDQLKKGDTILVKYDSEGKSKSKIKID
jgi:hypothetical protein